MMDKAYAHWKGEAPSARDHNERAAIAQYAHYFFDLNDIAPAVQNNVGREAAVYVKEVLDRIGLPPESEIPDHAAVAAGQLRLWRIPRTEITLVRIKDGLREGQWVFSSETDERAGVFFERVRKMPYRPGPTPGSTICSYPSRAG